MSEPALVLERVSATYGREPVLREVDLEVARGEIVGLVGPNGSGKTTLVRVASRTLRPSAGSIRVGGQDLMRMNAHDAARLVAVVPQDVDPGVHVHGARARADGAVAVPHALGRRRPAGLGQGARGDGRDPGPAPGRPSGGRALRRRTAPRGARPGARAGRARPHARRTDHPSRRPSRPGPARDRSPARRARGHGRPRDPPRPEPRRLDVRSVGRPAPGEPSSHRDPPHRS